MEKVSSQWEVREWRHKLGGHQQRDAVDSQEESTPQIELQGRDPEMRKEKNPGRENGWAQPEMGEPREEAAGL